MIYHAVIVSHGGNIRENNEDNAFLQGYYRHDNSLFEWRYDLKFENNGLAAVFDGMGGEADGEEASLQAAQLLNEYREFVFSKRVDSYIEDANKRIALNNWNNNMGTTCVILSIEDNCCHFFNLGDSRGYLYRKGQLKQMTIEHKDTNSGRNVLCQYLGMKEDGEVIIPECYHAPVYSGLKNDIYILCSDGLTNFMTDIDLKEILKSEDDLTNKADWMTYRILKSAANDNFTFILIKNCG